MAPRNRRNRNRNRPQGGGGGGPRDGGRGRGGQQGGKKKQQQKRKSGPSAAAQNAAQAAAQAEQARNIGKGAPKGAGVGWGGGYGPTLGPGGELVPGPKYGDGLFPIPEEELPEPSDYPDEFWDWLEDEYGLGRDDLTESALGRFFDEWSGLEEEPEPDVPGGDNDLLATIDSLLGTMGLNSPGLNSLAQQAIANGWSVTEFTLELRKHPDYLGAHGGLFAANLERAKQGLGFWSEGQVLQWAGQVSDLAKRYGFTPPPDSYLAQGFGAGKSLAEIEHLLQVQKQVDIYGPVFQGFVESEMGVKLGDEDLFEIFDDERDTAEFDDAFRAAHYRARPFSLGLGIRSEAEQRALEMLGVDPEEAFKRFETVAQNRPRFERLAQIEGMVTGNLPENFGDFLVGVDNGLLVRATVFQDPAALAEIQALASKEIARHNIGGGALKSATGQSVGLLTQRERATF